MRGCKLRSFRDLLTRVFSTPTFPDIERTRQCRLLNVLAWALIFAALLDLLNGFLNSTPEPAFYILVGSIIPISLISLGLMKREHVELASVLFTYAVWIWFTVILISVDPIALHINFAFYYLAIIAGGVLLGARAAIGLTIASAVVGAGLFYLAESGWPFVPRIAHNSLRNSIASAIGISLAAVYAAVVVYRLNQLLVRTKDDEGQRKLDEKALGKERDLVNALMEASTAVSGTLVFEDILDHIMDQISKVIPSDAVNIMLIEGNTGRIVRWRGYDKFNAEAKVANKTFEIDKTPNFRYMVETGKPIGEPNTENAPTWVRSEEFHWLRSYVGVPITVKDMVVGFLNVDSAKPDFYSPQQLKTLQAFAAQVALTVENSQLFTKIKRYADDLESAFIETTLALAKTLDVRDAYTADHGKVMANRAQRTLRELGGSEREILLIALAAQLHDIGKVGIPDSILHKPGPLSESEWRIMKRHPEIGAEIVSRVKGLNEVAAIILAHQEKFDGSGYPGGLTGEAIPLNARILSVIDAYGAMTENRVYRKAMTHAEAVAELSNEAGKQFDPLVVNAFLKIIKEEK